MKLIGLTGGVGMGKSTSAALLKERGHAVVDTDDLARQVVEPGQPALAEVARTFGETVIGPDGRLRRDEMAKLVFSDDDRRRQLEEILHPPIRERWLGQAEVWRREGRALGVVVIPLLFETDAAAEFEGIICVACSTESQHQRLSARGWSPEQIQQRVAAQWPVQKKMDLSHFLIWTEPGLDIHAAQLDCIVKCLTGQESQSRSSPR